MKKLLLGAILLGLAFAFPVSAPARVDIAVSLPPTVVFSAPPQVVVIPETYVYVVPDVDEDIFFYNGWWWRPWNGRWYRSRNYSSGWVYYRGTPTFYRLIPSDWRTEYREHRWRGHPWNHQPIPYSELHHNWRTWQTHRHWEKQHTWGVEGLRPGHKTREVHPVHKGKPGREVHRGRQGKPVSREVHHGREGKPGSHKAVKQRKPREGKSGSHHAAKPGKTREGKQRTHEGRPRSPSPESHGRHE